MFSLGKKVVGRAAMIGGISPCSFLFAILLYFGGYGGPGGLCSRENRWRLSTGDGRFSDLD